MPQQCAQAPHDGETETETVVPLARFVTYLMIFVEDRGKLIGGNADPGVPDFHA